MLSGREERTHGLADAGGGLTEQPCAFFGGGGGAGVSGQAPHPPWHCRAVRYGAAPDSWDALLTAMTHKGYTKQELISAGLAVNGKNGRLYDKFRNRLMLPVIDVRGDVVGFGSRVLDKSEPKYMNTPEHLHTASAVFCTA